MLDELVKGEFEPDGVSGIDVVCLGRSIGGAHIAAHVFGVDHIVGDRWHIAVGVLADVRVVRSDCLAVDDELREDVMSVGREWCCQQRRFEG